jgi:hypothetical protein
MIAGYCAPIYNCGDAAFAFKKMLLKDHLDLLLREFITVRWAICMHY